jgi:iron complex outermembrane receptor protein
MAAMCSTVALASGAYAQETAPASGDAPGALQEVVVTAQKRDEGISKVPIAITAIGAEELRSANVTNAFDLQYLAPNMQVTNNGQGIYLTIRGVTTTDTTSKGEPGIQFNTDGIPVARAEESAIAFFDLQRVEVLAGPQGTLYGKSSTGGAVNVITNAPSQREEGFASVALGNYDTKRFEGMFNAPLTDNIAVRAAISANYRRGYINLIGGGGLNQDSNSNPGDENDLAGRLTALGTFANNTTVRLTFTAGREGGVGYGNGSVGVYLNGNGTIHGTDTASWNPVAAYLRNDFQKTNGEIATDLGPARLTYLGSYSHFRTANNEAALQFLDPQNNGNGSASQGDRLLVSDSYNST